MILYSFQVVLKLLQLVSFWVSVPRIHLLHLICRREMIMHLSWPWETNDTAQVCWKYWFCWCLGAIWTFSSPYCPRRFVAALRVYFFCYLLYFSIHLLLYDIIWDICYLVIIYGSALFSLELMYLNLGELKSKPILKNVMEVHCAILPSIDRELAYSWFFGVWICDICFLVHQRS